MDVIYQLIDMAIEDKTGADSFKKVAFREAWKGRTRALWSIAALGVAAGVVVGADGVRWGAAVDAAAAGAADP